MKQIATKLGFAAVTALLLAISAESSQAQQTFIGTGTGVNAHHSAEATFQVTGNTLTIQLFNIGGGSTSSTGAFEQNSVLTGLFFNVGGGASLNFAGSTVALNSGSSYTTTDPDAFDGNVMQNWARKAGVAIPPQTNPAPDADTPIPGGPADYGIAASAYGTTFDNSMRFDDDPNNGDLDGPGYGLVNGSVPSSQTSPYINNSVVFTFTGTNLSSATFGSVYFKYDSGPGSLVISGAPTGVAAVPEPVFIQLGKFDGYGWDGITLAPSPKASLSLTQSIRLSIDQLAFGIMLVCIIQLWR